MHEIENEWRRPDAQLKQTDLPPSHDSKDFVQPSMCKEVNGIVPVIKNITQINDKM